MKLSLLLTVIVVFFLGDMSFGQVRLDVTLEQVVRLLGNQGNSQVGLEFLPNSRLNIANSDQLRQAISQVDVARITQIIAEETDYECLSGEGYILICPKANVSLHDLPLSMRTISFPEAEHLPYNQLLKQVKSKDGVYLCDTALFMGQLTEGSVSLKGGQCRCYELLNEMSKQMGVNYWIMTHMMSPDPQRKVMRAAMLNLGFVSFFESKTKGKR